jgi:hypothetical protein
MGEDEAEDGAERVRPAAAAVKDHDVDRRAGRASAPNLNDFESGGFRRLCEDLSGLREAAQEQRGPDLAPNEARIPGAVT